MRIGNEALIVCLAGPTAAVTPRLHEVLAAWLTPASRLVDYHAFHAGECPIREALDHARLFPMAGTCRVVVLRAIERLVAEEVELLEAYGAAPSPTGRLVLVGDETTSRELLQRLSAHGYAVEQLRLPPSPDDRLPPTVFELADAVGAGQSGRALVLASLHAGDGRRIPDVVGALGWHLRRLWLARQRYDAGVSLPVVAREARIPPRAASRWIAQVQRWRLESLSAAAQLLLRMDARLKRGEGEPALLLEMLVLQLTTLPDERTTVTSSARLPSHAAPL